MRRILLASASLAALIGVALPVAGHAASPGVTVPPVCIRIPIPALGGGAQIQIGYCPT